MTAQTAWLLAIFAVVIAGVIGFFVGRQFAAGKERIEELESEVKRQQDQIEDYRKEVSTHFDKTATLFVSMAGSYKELFEHLSSGYEKLSSGSARELFQQRVDAVLVGNGREVGSDSKLLTGVGLAAAAAAAGTAVASTEERAADAMVASGMPAATAEAYEEDDAEDRDDASTSAAAVAEEVRVEPSAAESSDAVTETAPAPDAAAVPRSDRPSLADDPLAEEVVGYRPPPRDEGR